MIRDPNLPTAATAALSDEEVVERIRRGEHGLFEIIMRRYNQRLYRVARAIVGDESEAEDILQDTYVRAYTHLEQFAGRAPFVSWLTRIAVHEAIARASRRRRVVEIDAMNEMGSEALIQRSRPQRSPEQLAMDRDLRTVLERAISELPPLYRSVLILRDVEGMNTEETAECLEVRGAVIKTRLHRGRTMLRRALSERSAELVRDTFPFHAERCDRVVAAVFARLQLPPTPSSGPVG